MSASLAFKTAVLLCKAREHLSDPGRWIKGTLRDGRSGRVCSVGAIHYAAHGFTSKRFPRECIPEMNESLRILDRAVGDKQYRGGYCGSGDCIIRFNDASKTQHADVLALFDRAIEQACEIVRKESGESTGKSK